MTAICHIVTRPSEKCIKGYLWYIFGLECALIPCIYSQPSKSLVLQNASNADPYSRHAELLMRNGCPLHGKLSTTLALTRSISSTSIWVTYQEAS